MAGRMPKVKTSGGMTPELVEFFDDITGSGAANLNIAVPKMREMRESALRYIMAMANCGDILADEDLDDIGEYFTKTATKFNDEFDSQLCAPHDLSADQISDADKEFRIEYGQLYKDSKRCEIVSAMLHTASELSWIPGGDTAPTFDVAWGCADDDRVRSVEFLKGSPVDLARLRVEHPEACAKIWPDVFKMFVASDEIFNTLNKPDFDPDVLVKAVNESIFRFEKDLRGCELGFNLVRKSSELFKKNAAKYQERMEASGNPMELYSCYFEDVQASANAMDRKTKMQFMRIVRHIKIMSAKSTAMGLDPKGARIMKMINSGVAATSAAVEEEMQREDSGGYQEMMEELRRTKEEDEARAAVASEVTVMPAGADHCLPSEVEGVPGNIDDIVAWIDEGPPAEKKTKKKSKKSKKSKTSS